MAVFDPRIESVHLTQGFFAYLLEHHLFAKADRQVGRFRSFLLGSVKHFLAHEHERATARKRGGGQPVLSLDQFNPEERYAIEPADAATPETIFDQRCARQQVENALNRLRAEYASAGRGPLFDLLKDYVWGDKSVLSLAAIVLDFANSEAVTWVDYDNDGYVDLFRAAFDQTRRLCRNNRDGTFARITQGDFLAVPGTFFGVAWGDYNNDGRPDLFLPTTFAPNYLYRNDGGGAFPRVGTGFLDGNSNSVAAAWAYPSTGFTLQQNAEVNTQLGGAGAARQQQRHE